MRQYKDYQKDHKSDIDLTRDEIKKVEFVKFKIIVPNEEEKIEFMNACKHIHDSDVLMIDNDYVCVNQIAHQYTEHNEIIVNKKLYDKLKTK